MKPRECAIFVVGSVSPSLAANLAARELERRGYSIWRIDGGDSLDAARSQAVAEALARGFSETFWIDSRLEFDPNDIVKVRSHNCPLVTGVYPAVGGRGLALDLLPGTRSLELGVGGGLWEVQYAAAGFLHVRKEVYETMRSCQLVPHCQTRMGTPFTPYFSPSTVNAKTGNTYLDGEFAFCERARQCGYPIMADTTLRLWRNDNYRYSWEDVNGGPPRNSTCEIRVTMPGDSLTAQDTRPARANLNAPFQSPQLDAFRAAHPWPQEMPAIPSREKEGWLFPSTQEMLSRFLTNQTGLVVELGSWLGLSTRFIVSRAPRATVIAIDHWQGSPEHQQDPQLQELLPVLYETFLVNCWNERARITPIRAGTLAGLERVAQAGLQPELIYVDADHSFEGVLADLHTIHRLFPQATIVGDDWNWEGVQRAATEFSSATGRTLEALEAGWCATSAGN